MSVNKSEVIMALMDIGMERVKAAGSLEGLAALLAGQCGSSRRSAFFARSDAVFSSSTVPSITAALQEAAKLGSKQELGEEELEQVAGGAWWEYLIPGYGIYAAVRDLVKYNQNQESQPAPGTPAAPGGSSNPQNNTQANTNNHSAQQASQTGNNQNSGGMNVS